jgi:hypothetical protein
MGNDAVPACSAPRIRPRLLSIRRHRARRTHTGPIGGPTCERDADMSQFLILIYDDENAWMNAAPDVSEQLMQGHMKFGENNAAAVQGGNALQSVTTATTLRPDGAGGFSVTDGPFAETKEAHGGYYLVEAADLDEAIALAKQVPVIKGGLEVRPIMVFS